MTYPDIKRLFRVFAFTFLTILLISSGAFGAQYSDLFEKRSLKWNGKTVNLRPLRKFYKTRHGSGVWTNSKGLNANGELLIKLLAKAGEDGLIARNYVRKFPKKLKTVELGRAELYLSQAFWRFSRDLYIGRSAPYVSESDIIINRKKADIGGWLKMAARRGPGKVFETLRPAHKQYLALRKKLAKTKNKKLARKIIINMERWRWLPRDLGKRHVLVNQAAFEMYIRENGLIMDRRKVVIGKPFHKTPMFSYAIKYAEFNPTWTVPRSIASEEFLPRLRRNSRYLEKRGFKIYSSWEEDAEELDAKSINWKKITRKEFPYRIVQKSGKGNALGKVKFMFPNRFKIYLHDTPSKKLFSQASRAYSHGCVRVEKPLEFAIKLFKSQRLSKNKIDKILATDVTTKVKMRKNIPIHLTYFSMWVEENGKLRSFKDVYNRDRLVSKILYGGGNI